MTEEEERALAAALFNRTWELLEKAERTTDEDAEMVHTTHASCFHWLRAGAPVNAARGEWQCSRVYATIKRAEPALFHARRCLELCERHGFVDWDLAFAYEALARAHALAGDDDEARRWVELALHAEIAEEEDRALVLADLKSIPL